MMTYMGFTIKREGDHVVVVSPDGVEWTEDTVAEAKTEIREYWMLRADNIQTTSVKKSIDNI